MCDNQAAPRLVTCVTNSGYTDWAAQEIAAETDRICFRIKRQNGEYVLFYSADEVHFRQIRLFSFINEDIEIKAGAYICSPKTEDFSATLKRIAFE